MAENQEQSEKEEVLQQRVVPLLDLPDEPVQYKLSRFDQQQNPFEGRTEPSVRSQKAEYGAIKLTNRKLREQALLDLVRKFRPLQTKAIRVAVKILDDEQASDSTRLKAASLVLTMYKDLVLQLYDRHYDSESNEEIQPQNGAILSLKVIDPEVGDA
jgi:hypothetical protein